MDFDNLFGNGTANTQLLGRIDVDINSECVRYCNVDLETLKNRRDRCVIGHKGKCQLDPHTSPVIVVIKYPRAGFSDLFPSGLHRATSSHFVRGINGNLLLLAPLLTLFPKRPLDWSWGATINRGEVISIVFPVVKNALEVEEVFFTNKGGTRVKGFFVIRPGASLHILRHAVKGGGGGLVSTYQNVIWGWKISSRYCNVTDSFFRLCQTLIIITVHVFEVAALPVAPEDVINFGNSNETPCTCLQFWFIVENYSLCNTTFA